jgi:hypothetical protein
MSANNNNNKIVTLAQLLKASACEDQTALFEKLFLDNIVMDIFESPLAISDSDIANVWLFTRKYYLSNGCSGEGATAHADKVQKAFAAKVCRAIAENLEAEIARLRTAYSITNDEVCQNPSVAPCTMSPAPHTARPRR